MQLIIGIRDGDDSPVSKQVLIDLPGAPMTPEMLMMTSLLPAMHRLGVPMILPAKEAA